MTPLSPCAVSTVSVVPGTVLKTKKLNCSTRFGFSRKLKTHTLSRQSVLLSLSTPSALRLPYSRGFTFHYGSRIHPLSATGTDVAVEEPDSPVEDEVSPSIAENPNVEPEASRTPAQSTRTRPVKKSEMPPVKNEELVPGATFTGKVRSIQPFGAFIDFGAFTDGLVHVSRLSDSYVKDVGSFVSVGQEVKVRLVEANMESGRISLTMRESDDTSKLQQRKDGPTSSDKAGSARRNASNPNQKRGETRKVSKFVKGQDLDGTVKNIARAGAFISLPEGEEGFLPVSEELDEGFGTAMGETSLQIGQEVSVRVLRIARGQVTLTMKKEENVQKVDLQFTQGVVHTATNPFVVAFRKNKDIATFLDEKEKIEKDAIKPLATTSLEELEGKELKPDAPEMEDQPIISEEKDTSASLLDESIEIETHSEETEAKAKEVSPETVGDYGLSNSSAETIDQILPLETSSVKEELQQQPEDAVVKEEMQNQTPNADNKVLSSAPAGDEEVGPDSRENGRITSSGVQPDDASVQVAQGTLVSEVEENLNDNIKDEVQAQPPATTHETPVASKFEDDKAASNPEKTADVTNSSGQNDIPFPKENVTKVTATISPALVKQLREDTGAGMMDCKKALSETGGDIVKAQEFLRKKGLASAEKKASRATAEGRIGSYIHDSRIGVLVEINCETDFVSRSDIFKELVDDMAMQVAASPQVQYLATENVPKEIVSKEREIEMQKEDLSSKPDQIRSRIVEGRINKRLEELALLEQPFIKNDKVVVKDLVKQTIATIGENIKVKRFVRYNLGEGLEKKSQDFAAEVAAQTAAKPEPKQHSAAKEPVQKALTVAVSASLVKQLREETGAGMMDCKKALAETGGVIEKAQEYLRKKGLSSAEKKSSRLAAEGRIGSYIHDSRVGVLIEVNCETDFVGRSEKFKELVDDLAMQIVACPQVQFVSIEDIPESIVNKEKELEMQREDILSKPENIRGRIVEGRISKRLGELALLEQPFVKNDSFLVKDLVKQTVAALGENIKVRRFVRFTLGETVENAKAELET